MLEKHRDLEMEDRKEKRKKLLEEEEKKKNDEKEKKDKVKKENNTVVELSHPAEMEVCAKQHLSIVKCHV